MKQLTRFFAAAALTALAWGLLCETASAKQTFISFNGRFYFYYPDTWRQIDFNTVNYFLNQSGVDVNTIQYEVVLAPKDSVPFHTKEYLFLTVDTIGAMTQARIDSVLGALRSQFGPEVTYRALGSGATDLKVDQPAYDAEAQTVSILSEVIENRVVTKKSLLVQKFFEYGIASFYFYSPDSSFPALLPVFQDMVGSFQSGEIEKVIPKGEAKIADVQPGSSGSSIPSQPLLWGAIAAAIAALLIMIIRMKRGKRA